MNGQAAAQKKIRALKRARKKAKFAAGEEEGDSGHGSSEDEDQEEDHIPAAKVDHVCLFFVRISA